MESFHLRSGAHKYKATHVVGKGSFGVVCAAKNERGRRVAIKRIRPYANDIWEARHTLREVRLCRLLAPCPHIITLLDLYRKDHDELYFVLELLDSDLHHVIQSNQVRTTATVLLLLLLPLLRGFIATALPP